MSASPRRWVAVALVVSFALIIIAILAALLQGDCGRSDDDGGDDGMEPAGCKPGDQTCNAGQLTTEPLPDLREGPR